jgi:uncharacterized protein (TIGR02453 family)
MKNVINFLSKLYDNNNRDWFNLNKHIYDAANKTCNTICEKLIAGIAKFDITIAGLSVKDCTYKIYRDIRFSPDKTPYKTHIGIYICRGGKKSNFAGYYFHIEPKGHNFLNNSLLCAGLYIPTSTILKSVREEIDFNGQEFIKNIKAAKGFSFDNSNKLKKIPKEFNNNSEFAEFLKQKDFMVVKNIDNDFLLHENLVENIIDNFKLTYNFVNQLNKAVEFANENY